MKAALYSRVSTEEQTEGNSLAAQRDAMKHYASSKQLEVFREYEDGGFTGGNDLGCQ